MGKLRALLSRLKSPLIRELQDRDLVLELDTHLQMLTEDNIRAGIATIVQEALVQCAVGILIGVPAAFAAVRLIANTRRATRIDPMAALRYE